MRKKGNRASRPSAAGRAAGGEGMAAASASGTLVGDSGMGQGMGQAAITLEKVVCVQGGRKWGKAVVCTYGWGIPSQVCAIW